MRPQPCLRFILATAVFFAATYSGSAASAPAYTFTTIAGQSNVGNVDGVSTAARFDWPAGIAADAAGNLYVVDSNLNTLRKVTPDAVVTTIAGSPGHSGRDDGIGSRALFANPRGVAVDSQGNVYIADSSNSAIRKMTVDGVVRTLAGGNRSGSADGLGNGAMFANPQALAVDSAGNIYVADTHNHTIRKVDPDGLVTTLAGTAGQAGSRDGIGAEARFNLPSGIGVDLLGNIYVADTENRTIRRITADGAVSTLAGSAGLTGYTAGAGANARFNLPTAIAVNATGTLYVTDSSTIRKITPDGLVTTFAQSLGYCYGVVVSPQSGDLYVADSSNHVILKIAANGTSTVLAGLKLPSGSKDGIGTAAQFTSPSGLAVDGQGTIFVADCNSFSIRRINAAGYVTTWAGRLGWSGAQDGVGTGALLRGPWDLTFDGQGNLFVAEFSGHGVRRIDPAGWVTTIAGGTEGYVDGKGTAARFRGPMGIAIDRDGNLFVAEAHNHTIRRIDRDGNVTTPYGQAGVAGHLDGAGNAAKFHTPAGIAFDDAGNLYVGDVNNHAIRKISPDGVVTTFAGGPGAYGNVDGIGSGASFSAPYGVALDRVGNLFVADSTTHTIRMVTAEGGVSTIGGTGYEPGFRDGRGIEARFNHPQGIAVDRFGHLYVADSSNNCVRKGIVVGAKAPAIERQPGAVTVGAGRETSMTVAASGLPVPLFQWQRKRAGETTFVALSESAEFNGVESATLTVTASSSMAGDQFRCVAENGIGAAVFSQAATLTVISPPTFSSAAETTFTVGASGSFKVAATGATSLTLKSGTLPAWARFDPATGVLSGTPTELAAAPLQLVFAASNAALTPTEQPFTLTISAGPLVLTDPTGHTANAGATAILSVEAAGAPPLSYRWTKDGVPIANSPRISGTDGPVLALGQAQLADAGAYAVTVTGPDGNAVTSRTAVLSVVRPPTIATAPASAMVVAGSRATFSVAATSTSPLSFQWLYNGDPIAGENAPIYAIAAVNPGWMGLYAVRVSDAATGIVTTPVILGVPIGEKLWGWGTEAGADIVHRNGNVYDQVLLTSATAALKADPGQITRLSFIDLNHDIVQVEFSGAGTLHVRLKNASSAAAPLLYNQNVRYVKGHAGITIVGADETTHVAVLSVGRVTAVNQDLFREEVDYDGMADIAFIAISSTNGKFGGIYAGNTVCSDTTGPTGIFAPGVECTYRVVISDINASDSAQPWLLLGHAEDVRIAGGDLAQANHRPLTVDGFAALQMTTGSNSHGVELPAQPLRARVERNGEDITDELVRRD